VTTILAKVGGSLRRLAPHAEVSADATAVDFGPLLQLRRVGPVHHLPTTVSRLDLSHLRRLVRIDDDFGADCVGLRAVLLPATVTSIGNGFLANYSSTYDGVLDLSYLAQLRSIGGHFAAYLAVIDVVLPVSLETIGECFLDGCRCLAVLDFSHLSQLRAIGSHFASGSTVSAVKLPPSVTAIGESFLLDCEAVTDVIDLSHVTQLRYVGRRFARGTAAPDVVLPANVVSDGRL
jgi:hypothetical protein